MLVSRAGNGTQNGSTAATLNPAHTKKLLKGDLDNIILKALRKDPARRYGSAEQLLQDIQNYQNNLPVTARPESLHYRARKFIARHRVGVAAAAIVAISLLTTTVVSVWQAEQARAERDRTLKINEFLQTILTEADPYQAGADATIRDVLRKAGELVSERFPAQPELEAPLRYTIGYTQLGLMELDDSYTNLKISEELYTALYGPGDSRTLTSSSYLAWLDFRRGYYDAAIDGYRTVIGRMDARTPWDTRASILNDYAVVLLELERYDDALEIQLEVRDLWMDNDPTRPEVAVIHNNLAQTYHGLEDYELAEQNYRTGLAMFREIYEDGLHPDISATLNNLGVLLRDMGNSDDAIEHYKEALRIRQLTLGEAHPLTAFSHMNVARFLLDLERFEDARPHATLAHEIMASALAETHLHLLLARSTVARIYLHDREYARAETTLQNVLSNMDEEYVPGWIIEEANRWLAVARNEGEETEE